MADRYWVGGTASWNTTAGAKWATTSGGAGGASVPTSADNVFFDANSGAVTVTIAATANCANLTCTGFIGTLTGSSTLNLYGNLTLVSGMTFSHSGTVSASGTTTQLITSAGKSFNNFLVQGATSVVSLQDNLIAGSNITLNAGTFTTNNFNVQCANFTSTGTSTRTVNLGSSTVTVQLAFNTTSTGMTFNSGTSTMIFTSAAPTFTSGGLTFYNVSFTGGSTSTIPITGANTFNNFSVTADTSGTKNVTFDSTNTINGTLTTSGTTTANRIQFGSSVAGTQRTLSVATMGTLTNTNWQDIALTGAASPWTAPTSIWGLGNTSGIIFTVTTYYWVGGTGTWNRTTATNWATSSGGSGGAGVPGPNDNVIIDNSSGTGTITLPSTEATSALCKNFTVTATNALTLGSTGSRYMYIYGNFSIPSTGSFTISLSVNFYFLSTSTGNTINTGGKTTGITFTFNGIGGEWTLQSNVTLDSISSYISILAGSFVTNNYSISAGYLDSTGGGFTVSTRSITLGSSTITLNNVSAINFGTTADPTFTLNAGTSTINCTYDFVSFRGNGKTFYNVNLTGSTASSQGLMSGENTFNNLTINGYSTAAPKVIVLYNSQTINGTFTVTGSNGNRRVLFITLANTNLQYTIANSQLTITAGAVSLTDVDFCGIIGAGTATWSGTRLSDGGNNSGITFDAPKTVYWNLAGGGNYLTSTAWATSSGGTPATTNFPLGQDTAIIEDTGLNSGASISIPTVPIVIGNLNCSTRTNSVTISLSTGNYAVFSGNITLSNAVTLNSGTLVITGNVSLTPNSASISSSFNVKNVLTISGTSSFTGSTSGYYVSKTGTLNLSANLTLTNSSCDIYGTINLNSYNFTSKGIRLMSAGTTNFGTGKIVSAGNFVGYATQTYTGSKRVDITAAAAVTPGATTEANSLNFYFSGSGAVSLDGNSNDVDFTGYSGTLSNSARSIFGNLTISTGMTLTAGTNETTFAATSGTKTITTNGKTLDFPITFNGVGGTWQLQDNLTQGSTRATTLTNGTVNLNGKTYTVGSFATATGTKNITFNAGALSVPAVTTTAFNNAQPTNFTTTAGTGTGKISMTGATAKTFVGGGSTYNCTLEQAGAGTLTITGSNTFNNITNTTQPVSVLFTAGTTNTFNNFSLSGTSGSLVTIGSVTAASHTLSKSSGTVSVQYCSISRSTATGGAVWESLTTNGNVNGGNNSGWIFSYGSGNGLFFGSNF